VRDVIVNTIWCEQVWHTYSNDIPTGKICFLMTDRIEDDTPTANVRRGGAMQPQALGQQRRSNVGSGAASSSTGRTSTPQAQGEAKVFNPKTAGATIDKSRRVGSRGSPKRSLLLDQRGDLPDADTVVVEIRMKLVHDQKQERRMLLLPT
jgi:hypothetical protein